MVGSVRLSLPCIVADGLFNRGERRRDFLGNRAGSRKQLNRVRWQGATGSPYPASSPTDYSIQVSDDGTNWRTILTRNNTVRVAKGDELINEQARFLRLVTTQVDDGTGWSLSFFEFWAEGY